MTLRFILLLCFISSIAFAQEDSAYSYSKHRDVIDIAEKILGKSIIKRDTAKKKSGRLYVSGAPSVGYALASGWAGLVVANGAFYASNEKGIKLSNIYFDAVYTQMHQSILHLQSNIWSVGNKYNIVNDWRYYAYPQKTYGLGGETDLNKYANQSFNYLRLYQTVMRTIRPSLYAGVGFGIDYHWNITGTSLAHPDGDSSVIANINQYGISSKSMSSGVSANLLYDNRINSINPAKGTYANIVFRQNLSMLGSDTNWESLLIDLRHYIPFPRNSENVLAFWSYNWLTLAGHPPYLDLPSTSWDAYGNTGEGYIQGRFRSMNMLFLEAEYRFKVLNNGLLGGVVFANAQSFTDWPSNQFKSIAPAGGLGIRIKFNKYSRTNIAIDYAWGLNGSQGVFANLGEVF